MMYYLGAFIVLIFSVIIIKLSKKSNYDERQELIRGRGYRYGFLTTISFGAIVIILNYQIKISTLLAVSLSLFVGIWVFSVYTIWNSAYLSLNQRGIKLLSYAFMLIGLIDGFKGTEGLIKEFELESNIFRIFIGIFLFSIGGMLIFCSHRDQNDKD